jgi:hypothetical protein
MSTKSLKKTLYWIHYNILFASFWHVNFFLQYICVYICMHQHYFIRFLYLCVLLCVTSLKTTFWMHNMNNKYDFKKIKWLAEQNGSHYKVVKLGWCSTGSCVHYQSTLRLVNILILSLSISTLYTFDSSYQLSIHL